MIRRFLPVLLLASAPLLHAALVFPTISSPHTSMTDTATVFTGGARLTYGNLLLTADEIDYNPKTQVAHAIGNVVLTRGPERLLADDLTYNLPNKTYTAKNFRAGMPPFYIAGVAAEGSPVSSIIHNAEVTFTEPSIWTPTLKAGSLIYKTATPGDEKDATIRPGDGYVGVGPLTLIPVPAYAYSPENPLLDGMTFQGGFDSRFGAFVNVGLLTPVTPSLRLGGDVGIYTSRGVLIGPGWAYKFSDSQTTVVDKLKTGYIDDHGDVGEDILDRAIPQDRGYVSWDHYQTVGDDVTLLGSVNYWSDSYIVRDYYPQNYNNVQNPDSFFEADYTQPNYIVSAFTRFSPNNFEAVQQRLPEVDFDGLPIELVDGIYHRFSASIAVLSDVEPSNTVVDEVPTTFTDNLPTTDRLDAFYGLERTFTDGDWLSFKPVAGARLTYYDQALDGRSDYTRFLGEVGFDAQLHANGVSNYKNEVWDIDGLRHLLTPYISYRYIPQASQGQEYIPPIDRDTFSTYLQPLDLGDRRDIDTIQPTNTFRLGVDNVLQTRDPGYGSRNLVDLNVATDWNLQPEGNTPFDTVQSELTATPANWLQFDLYDNVNPNTWSLDELSTGVTFKSGDVWSVRFGTDYLRSGDFLPYPEAIDQQIPGFQQYTTEIHYHLNEIYEAIAYVAFDAQASRFTEQDYILRQSIHDIWFLDYVVSLTEGNTRESAASFSIRFELARF